MKLMKLKLPSSPPSWCEFHPFTLNILRPSGKTQQRLDVRRPTLPPYTNRQKVDNDVRDLLCEFQLTSANIRFMPFGRTQRAEAWSGDGKIVAVSSSRHLRLIETV